MRGGRRRVNYSGGLAALVALALLGGTAGVGRALAAAPERGAPEIPRDLPDGYLVLPFENAGNVATLEWMRVALPMMLGEKLEAHPGLRAMYGPLVVPDGAPPKMIDAATVAAAGKAGGAHYVWTGSFTRPDWKLEIEVKLWAVDGDTATLIGEKKEHGDFAGWSDMIDDATLELCAKAGRPASAEVAAKIKRKPTNDFYSFTLFGRGLMALHGFGKAPDLAAAEKHLTRALYIEPKFAEAHRVLALVYAAKGEGAKAQGQLAYALDLKPEYYAALAATAKAAYASKERGEAIRLAGKALILRPWDLDERFMLGATLWEEGDVDGAYRELERLVAVRPDHLPARRILVLIHATQGDAQALATELEAIVKLDPDDVDARLDLGAAYHALSRDDDAIATYEAVIAKNPKHMQALKFLGDLYRGKGDLKTAIAYYEKALDANRNDPRPYFLLGAAYVESGDDRKAIHIYNLAEYKFPQYLGDTYNNLGSIYYRQGDNEQAIWYLGIATKKKPSSPRVHYNYGLALSKAKRRDAALGELDRAAELDPQDADVQYARGVVLLRMGKIEDAETAFKEAVRLNPADEDAKHDLAMIEELRRRAREGEIKVE